MGTSASCAGDSDWCQVQVGDYRGYLKRSQFWGALPERGRFSQLTLWQPRGGRGIRPRMDKDVPRAHHDLGGVSKFLCEPVDVEPHALTDFDKEVDALRGVLGMKRVMTVDELRRGIEAIPEADYHRLSYYRRWIRSITDNLLVKGVITEAELRAALDRV